MNLLSAIRAAFRAEPAHTEVRYVAATRAESKLARRKQIDRQLELAVAISRLTPEQAQSARMRGMGGGR